MTAIAAGKTSVNTVQAATWTVPVELGKLLIALYMHFPSLSLDAWLLLKDQQVAHKSLPVWVTCRTRHMPMQSVVYRSLEVRLVSLVFAAGKCCIRA